jgi:hypothetical protein
MSSDVCNQGTSQGCSNTSAATPKSAAPDWFTARHDNLPAVIAMFKAALPGWWYSVCECQVSCDASCAPTTDSLDIALAECGNDFDGGFHADLPQPSTLAQALLHVLGQALEAKAKIGEAV